MGSKAFVSQLFTGIFLLTIVLAEFFISRIGVQRQRRRQRQLVGVA